MFNAQLTCAGDVAISNHALVTIDLFKLAVLAEGLRAYEDCKKPLQLFNIVSEKRYGLGSLLNFSCSCAVN